MWAGTWLVFPRSRRLLEINFQSVPNVNSKGVFEAANSEQCFHRQQVDFSHSFGSAAFLDASVTDFRERDSTRATFECAGEQKTECWQEFCGEDDQLVAKLVSTPCRCLAVGHCSLASTENNRRRQ